VIGRSRPGPGKERRHAQHGQAEIASVLVLVVVLGAVAVSAGLLWRTLSTARSINERADTISMTATGINVATDSINRLNQTNETAASILNTAEPLEGLLAEIVALAQAVDGLAASINSTAGGILGEAQTINRTAAGDGIGGTAAGIDATAAGINQAVVGILDVAGRINSDVVTINNSLDGTIGLAQAIQGDTSNILTTARSIHFTACGIDRKLILGPMAGQGICN
jgi:hypothetical protein